MSSDLHPSSRDQDSDRQQARVARAAAIRDHILRSRRTLPALAIFGAVAALQGCCIAVGGSPRQEAPTMGRQLIDLKAALDAGAMSEAEYSVAKAQILNPPH
jgi:hypothetical protein